jgi:hypothetical protein
VALTVNRPLGIAGNTLTIDRSALTVTPGTRATDSRLELELRSSQGGQHAITLPERARLQSVKINGRPQPVRQEKNRVTLPIVPGRQRIVLDWRLPRGGQNLQRTPQVQLGLPSVNSTLHLRLSRDRWVLFAGGPRLGPAVLFWGVLMVLALLAWGLGRLSLTPLKSYHWFLLGVGLSQTPVWAALVVVGWLLALGARDRIDVRMSAYRFNAVQIGLALLTVATVPLLFYAVKQGLLGMPAMQVSGGGSTAYALSWYQDRITTDLPTAWVLSLPLLVYRLLMLAWALWLALALLRWLRWGWQCYARHGLWRKPPKKPQADQQEAPAKDADGPAPEKP